MTIRREHRSKRRASGDEEETARIVVEGGKKNQNRRVRGRETYPTCGLAAGTGNARGPRESLARARARVAYLNNTLIYHRRARARSREDRRGGGGGRTDAM